VTFKAYIEKQACYECVRFVRHRTQGRARRSIAMTTRTVMSPSGGVGSAALALKRATTARWVKTSSSSCYKIESRLVF
jgi:hypothetical protein